jgi:2-polyprenyl-3-methyl-5-hydroxy-6-metoxy-1,4-benzoquinol methylase
LTATVNVTDFDARAGTWDEDPSKRARAAAVAAGIRGRVNLSADMAALEYGAGTGLLSFELAAELGPITLTDSSSGMLDVARAKVAASKATRMTVRPLDLTRDPLPLERYDLVYSMMTLHHVPDTADLLGKLHTLLRPDGCLCIADLDAEDGSFHGVDVDVHHGFDRDALAAQLRAAGFADVRIDTCFEIPRGARVYTVFLAVARRS